MSVIHLPAKTVIASHFYYPSGTPELPRWEYECAPHAKVHAFAPNGVLYTGFLAEMELLPLQQLTSAFTNKAFARYEFCTPAELLQKTILALESLDDIFNTTIPMHEIPLSRRQATVVQLSNRVCLFASRH